MITEDKFNILQRNISSSLVPSNMQINSSLQEMLKARNNFEKYYNETTIILFKNDIKVVEYKVNKGELPHLCGLKNIKKECLDKKKNDAYKKLKEIAGKNNLNMINIFDVMLDNQKHFKIIQESLDFPLIDYKKVEAKSEVFRKLNPLFGNEVINVVDNKSKFRNIKSPSNTYIVQKADKEDIENVTHYLLGCVVKEKEQFSNTLRVEKNRMNNMKLEKYDGIAIKSKNRVLFFQGNIPISYKKNYINNQLGNPVIKNNIKVINKNIIKISTNNNIKEFIHNNLNKIGTTEIAYIFMNILNDEIVSDQLSKEELMMYTNRTFNKDNIKHWDLFNYIYAIKNNSEIILKNPYWSKRKGRIIEDDVDTLADYVTFTIDAEGISFTKRSLLEFIKSNDFNKILKYMNYRKYFKENFNNKDMLINYMFSYLEFIVGDLNIHSIEELVDVYIENVVRIKNNIKEDYRKYDGYER